MHLAPSKETETASPQWQSMWLEDASDTLMLAQSLMQLAESSPYGLTPESLEMAVAVFQAAARLQSPPVYETDGPTNMEKLQRRMKSVEEELRAVKEETSRAFLALNTKLDTLVKLVEDQTVHFDTTAKVIEEESGKCSARFEDLNSRFDSVAKEVSTLMVAADRVELEASTPTQATVGLKDLVVDEEWTQVRHGTILRGRENLKGQSDDPAKKGGENTKRLLGKTFSNGDLAESEPLSGRRAGRSIAEATQVAVPEQAVPSRSHDQMSSCIAFMRSGTTSNLAPEDNPITLSKPAATSAGEAGTKPKNTEK